MLSHNTYCCPKIPSERVVEHLRHNYDDKFVNYWLIGAALGYIIYTHIKTEVVP